MLPNRIAAKMLSVHRLMVWAGTLVLIAADLRAQEPAPRPSILPTRWLILSEVAGTSDSVFSRDPVFARYLLHPESIPPKPDEAVAHPDGKDHRWVEFEGSEVRVPNGYAYTTVRVKETQVWMARVSGADTVYMNGEVCDGEDLLCVYSFACTGIGKDLLSEVGVVADSGPVGCRLGYQLSLWGQKSELPPEGLLLDPTLLKSD